MIPFNCGALVAEFLPWVGHRPCEVPLVSFRVKKLDTVQHFLAIEAAGYINPASRRTRTGVTSLSVHRRHNLPLVNLRRVPTRQLIFYPMNKFCLINIRIDHAPMSPLDRPHPRPPVVAADGVDLPVEDADTDVAPWVVHARPVGPPPVDRVVAPQAAEVSIAVETAGHVEFAVEGDQSVV